MATDRVVPLGRFLETSLRGRLLDPVRVEFPSGRVVDGKPAISAMLAEEITVAYRLVDGEWTLWTVKVEGPRLRLDGKPAQFGATWHYVDSPTPPPTQAGSLDTLHPELLDWARAHNPGRFGNAEDHDRTPIHHRWPLTQDSTRLPCCGVVLFELPRGDRLTADPALVTCSPRARG